MDDRLAIDFGTSNSAAAIWADGKPSIIEVEAKGDTMPTALFFDFEEKSILYGSAAAQALEEGAWGRYMRALKSLLGTSLIHESSVFLGKRMSYVQIVGLFLAELKKRAEAATGQKHKHALSGRPVRFHADAARDAQALKDLRACYAAAGFESVDFLNEPEAAARARQNALTPGDLGLVIDIGGGTSDFTLFQTNDANRTEVLHSEGLRLGGTDFDRLLSLAHVMPLLGLGSDIKHAFGSQTHLAPNGIFADLATWQKIPFLYTSETRRAAKDLLKYAVEPNKLARLSRVLEDELGHDIAFAVEAAKIELNSRNLASADIDLKTIERNLTAPLPSLGLNYALTPGADQIGTCAKLCVETAGLKTSEVTHLIMVGGSSLMNVVETSVQQQFPQATLHKGGALTGIIEGLALALPDHTGKT